jgi:hypothetical protein
MKLSPVLIFAMVAINAAHAAPPACQDMADKVAKKFEAEKKMAGPSQAKCTAISLVISDLTDLATLCTQGMRNFWMKRTCRWPSPLGRKPRRRVNVRLRETAKLRQL